jgi:hypothetical protein
MKKQEYLRYDNTALLPEDFHHEVNYLLVILNDQKKEEFWNFVKKNRDILDLFPSKPEVSDESVSWIAEQTLDGWFFPFTKILKNITLLNLEINYIKKQV